MRALHDRILRLGCRLLLLLGRETAARRLFDRLLSRKPQDAHALASRGHLRAMAGDREGAIADYRRLLNLHPGHGAAAWFNLGYLLEAEGRLDEAEEAFRRSIVLDEGCDRAWYGLGKVLAAGGRDGEALAALQRNVALQPLNPHGFEALVRLHLQRQEREEACRRLRQLRDFEPEAARRLAVETGLQA